MNGRRTSVAKARNSRDTQSRGSTRSTAPPFAAAPGSPNGDGTATVKPGRDEVVGEARAPPASCPGTSGTSTTPGPLPRS